MKKILLSSGLYFPALFIGLLILTAQVCFAQDCVTEAANKPSTLVRTRDNIYPMSAKMNAGETAKMKPYLAKTESWVRIF